MSYDHFTPVVEAVDAMVFSGDSLVEEKNRIEFKRLLDRWSRGLASMESLFANTEIKDGN